MIEEKCTLRGVDGWEKTTKYTFMNERVARGRVIKIEGRNQQWMIWDPGDKEKIMKMELFFLSDYTIF